MKICGDPVRLDWKTILFPSADHDGFSSTAESLVRRVWLEPSASITEISLFPSREEVKTIFPFVPGKLPELTGFVRTADTITSTMADSMIDMPVSGLKN